MRSSVLRSPSSGRSAAVALSRRSQRLVSRALAGSTLLATISARDAPFAALDAPVVEDFGEAGIAGGLEAQALAADRARRLVLQGIEGDGGDVGLARLFLHRFGAPPGPEPGDDVLGSAGTSGAASSSGGRPWSSASARAVTSLPLLARDRIVGAEIEQRPVAHPVADALGEHQPVASDGLAVLVVWVLGALMYRARAKGWRCVAQTRAPARLARGISTQRQSPGPTKDFRAPTSNI